jgi:FkbM family methyltransferase
MMTRQRRSLTYERGGWRRASLSSRLKEGAKQAIKAPVEALGFEIRPRPSPWWVNDPWLVQRRLLGSVRRPVIFDVGANMGQTLENYAAAFPGATIHSFEPFPESFRQLAETASRHRGAIPHQLALADAAGERPFFVNPEWHTRNSLLPRPAEGRRYYRAGSDLTPDLKVQVDTLDAFCAGNHVEHISILKLDVQGGESMVLRGAERLLSREAIDMIFTEVMFVPHYEGGPLFHRLWGQLEEKRYSFFNLFDIIVARNGQLRYANALFLSSPTRARVIDAFPEEP